MSSSGEDRPLRILYVLPYVPSPVRVRPFQLIRHLAAMGHEITVVALEDGLASPAARAELSRVCREVYVVPLPRQASIVNAMASLPTSTPIWAAWCRSPRMALLLRNLADPARFDVAHVEHLRAAHFAPALAALPCVLDAVDCITTLRRQMADQKDGAVSNRVLSWIEWTKLRSYEPYIYKTYRRIAVTSEHDANSLEMLDRNLGKIEVVPNGVDMDYFRPNDEKPDSKCLVFSGKMSYSANDDAARYVISAILPRLRTLHSDVRLTIVGSGPSRGLRAAADRAGGVEVTGYVDDIRPFLSNALFAVCPMRIGVGIQNKVLEAMAVSRTVVCSSLAARAVSQPAIAGGEGGEAAKPIHVADEPDDFAHCCAQLLDTPQNALRDGIAARSYVENYHDWKTASARFALLYRTVISR